MAGIDPMAYLEKVSFNLPNLTTNEQIMPVLHELDRSLYAQTTQPWDGAAAWQVLSAALTRLDRTTSATHKDGALPPLYPQGS